MTRLQLRIGLVITIAALAFVWWRYAPARDGVYVIKSRACAWTIAISNGVVQTILLEHLPSRTRLPIEGDDFLLRVGTARSIGWRALAGPGAVTRSEFCVRDGVLLTPRACVARWVIRGLRSTTFVLQPQRGNFQIALRFEPDRAGGWLRRTITLRATDAQRYAIDFADQTRWQVPVTVSGGGRGQPLWLANTFFCGLEHPFNDNFVSNGLVVLRQYPGASFGVEPLALQTMVVGAAAPGQAHLAFSQYMAALRRPPRAVTIYNTWCDLRDTQLTFAAVTNQVAALRTACTRYNLPLEVIVLDDGWEDKNSIWFPRVDRFPGGLAPLGAALTQLGFRTGLWLPLSGTMLNVEWGGARGYEVACQTYYCMSGTNYNGVLRDRICELVNDMDLALFKHDFNYFVCGRSEHGHFPGELQSSEANVNALLDLLRMERRLRPDLYLAVTSGLWPSPWWLPYCDTIWMGGKDHDFDKRLPASRGSAFEMNYRDGALYQLLVADSNTFPLSALMTHGIVDARHTVYDVAAEDDEGWANYLMNYLGRGTLMRELYITPDKLSPLRWDILGHGLRWATTLNACMAQSAFTLGDPRTGAVFAYTGNDGRRAYASIRNPSLRTLVVRADQLGLTNEICDIVYPWHLALRNCPDLSFDIPPEAVVQIESYPRSAITAPLVLGTRARVTTANATTTEFAIAVDGAPREVTLAAAPGQRITAVNATGTTVLHGEDGIWRVRVGDLTARETTCVRGATMAPGPAFTADILVPPQEQAWLKCVLWSSQALAPKLTINNVPTVGAWHAGTGWQLLTLRLQPGANDVRVQFQKDAVPSNATAQVFLTTQQRKQDATLTVTHSAVATSATRARPLPLLQDVARSSHEVLAPVNLLAHADALVDHARIARVQRELAGARAAVLLLDCFDVNGGDYANKQLFLNGVFIGQLPSNPPPLAAWAALRVPLPKESLAKLGADNMLTLVDNTGDSYKVRLGQLLVTLRDGQVKASLAQSNVFSTAMSWKHAEGRQIPRDGAPMAVLSF